MPRTLLPPWLTETLNSPVAAAAALTLGVKVGQEAYKLQTGEIDPEQFKRLAGRHVGAVTGTMTGAMFGSFVGKLIPNVGRIVGAFGGGVAGQMVGEFLGRQVAERVRVVMYRPSPPEPEPETQPSSLPETTASEASPLHVPRRDL